MATVSGTYFASFISGSDSQINNSFITNAFGGMTAWKLPSEALGDVGNPNLLNHIPTASATDVNASSSVSFLIDDSFTGSATTTLFGQLGGIWKESVNVQFRINSGTIIDVIKNGSFQTGFDGTGSVITPSGTLDANGHINGFQINIDLTGSFPSEAGVEVFITGSDVYENSVSETYFFTIAAAPVDPGQPPDIIVIEPLPGIIEVNDPPNEADVDIIVKFDNTLIIKNDDIFVDGRNAIREYTANGSPLVQAPFHLMTPGTARLRTLGRTPYTLIKSTTSFNNTNGTFFPIGTSSS